MQRTKSDIVKVRVMVKNVQHEDFLMQVNSENMIALKSIFQSNDLYFYNPTNGSTHDFLKSSLGFEHATFKKFTNKLGDAMNHLRDTMNVECIN